MTTPPLQTLNPVDAHQALGSVVTLYTGIVADYERNMGLLRTQLAAANEEIKRLRVIEAGVIAKEKAQSER